MKFRITLFIMVTLFSTCAVAETQQFANGQAVTLEPDRAYILVRVIGEVCGLLECEQIVPVFVRTLSSEELSQAAKLAKQNSSDRKGRAESNVVVPSPDQPYAEEKAGDFFLVSLRPGTYVLDGLTIGFMLSSFSMGTVEFEASPGTVTDLGTIVTARDDQPTSISDLSNYVTGKSMGEGTIPYVAAIRPASSTIDVPEMLKSLPLVAADYRAVAPFPNYTGAPLMRLAPLTGVLAYDKDGDVIDLKAEQGAGH